MWRILLVSVCLYFLVSTAMAAEWAETYGGTGIDWAYSIQQTSDGGYVVAGSTSSFGDTYGDVWILKLDSNGDIEWQKTYGGDDWDLANSIRQTSDGGYVVAGRTLSFGAGYRDVWILKLDSNGDIEWQKTYGGDNGETISSIQQTSDGGYVVAGVTGSFGAGLSDFWILKLDSNGNIPGCQYSQDTNAQVTDTTITPATSSASSATSNAQVTDTSVTPQDTQAEKSEVCYYSLPTQSIPEFGTAGLVLASAMVVVAAVYVGRKK